MDIRFHDMLLSYEPGKVMMTPMGNYNNQRWKVSTISNSTNTVCGNTNNNNQNNQNNNETKDDVNLNVNLTQDILNMLI